jgi:hypothetical protein
VVESGKDLVYDVGVGLTEGHGVKGVLGEGGVDAFAWSRGASEELSLLRARGTRARADVRGKDFLLGRGAGAELEAAADAERPKPMEVRGSWDIVFPEGGERGSVTTSNREDKEVNCSKRITIWGRRRVSAQSQMR